MSTICPLYIFYFISINILSSVCIKKKKKKKKKKKTLKEMLNIKDLPSNCVPGGHIFMYIVANESLTKIGNPLKSLHEAREFDCVGSL